jgi:hypothetical protein
MHAPSSTDPVLSGSGWRGMIMVFPVGLHVATLCISTELGHRVHCKGVGVGGLAVVTECFLCVAVDVGGGGGPRCVLHVRGV